MFLTDGGEMAVVDLIQQKVKSLPEPTQQEVLDFVDYLLQRARQEDVLWSKLSLRWALRGLEDEETSDCIGYKRHLRTGFKARVERMSEGKGEIQMEVSEAVQYRN